MSDNIDTRVSPALDPEVIRLMDGFTDEDAQFVGGVVNAFNDAYQTLSKLNDARELWQSNPAVTKEAAVVIVKKEADKHQQRVLQRFDLADRDLAANIEHTETELSRPLAEKASLGPINTEVRAFVRGMKRSEREAFMREKLEQGDDQSLAAILGAPHYLSGLTQVDGEHYTRTYHERKRPDLVRRLDLMRRVSDRLHASRPILFAQFAKAIGADAGAAAHLQRANEQALAALNIEPTA